MRRIFPVMEPMLGLCRGTDMKLNPTTIRRLRDERAWSQERLAEIAGLSLRTVQRVESDGNASHETRLALAGAFGVDLAELSPPQRSEDQASGQPISPVVTESVLGWSRVGWRLARLAAIAVFLVVLDLILNQGRLVWAHWPVLGLSIAALLSVWRGVNRTGRWIAWIAIAALVAFLAGSGTIPARSVIWIPAAFGLFVLLRWMRRKESGRA